MQNFIGGEPDACTLRFAGWVYIALVALVHPRTLGLQLTHLPSSRMRTPLEKHVLSLAHKLLHLQPAAFPRREAG
jgi:hypothetical protein